mgnify:FL=1
MDDKKDVEVVVAGVSGKIGLEYDSHRPAENDKEETSGSESNDSE